MHRWKKDVVRERVALHHVLNTGSEIQTVGMILKSAYLSLVNELIY